jgi:hypothetical protein
MYKYTFYDNDSNLLLSFGEKYNFQLLFGDIIEFKNNKYKIVGSKFNIGESDERRKSFYVELISI